MKVVRPLLACLPVLFLSGAIVMMFFTHLAGITKHNPLNRVFFLSADTRGIPNAHPRSHWTLYNICGSTPNGRNVHCSGRHAATPMLPQQNFRTNQNIPGGFLHRPNKYYYLSRFFYAFSIITIFFTLLALGIAFLSFCSYLGAALAGAMACWALFLHTFTTCIMTAVYTMAQNTFRDAGRDAHVGAKAFAFMWTSLFLIFLSSILLWMSYLMGHHKRDIRKRQRDNGNTYMRQNPGMVMGAGDAGYTLNTADENDQGMSTGARSNGSNLTPARPFNKEGRRHRLMANYARGGFFRPGPAGAPDDTNEKSSYHRSGSRDSGFDHNFDQGRAGTVSRGTDATTDNSAYSDYNAASPSSRIRFGNVGGGQPTVEQAEYVHATPHILSPTEEVSEGTTPAFGHANGYLSEPLNAQAPVQYGSGVDSTPQNTALGIASPEGYTQYASGVDSRPGSSGFGASPGAYPQSVDSVAKRNR